MSEKKTLVTKIIVHASGYETAWWQAREEARHIAQEGDWNEIANNAELELQRVTQLLPFLHGANVELLRFQFILRSFS